MLGHRIGHEEVCPLGAAASLVEQREGGVRVRRGVDRRGGEHAFVGELHTALPDTREQGDGLLPAEVRPAA